MYFALAGHAEMMSNTQSVHAILTTIGMSIAHSLHAILILVANNTQ
jgi:adenylosuccinate lyase